MPSIRIIAVDMSYRDTGVCVLSVNDGTPTIHRAYSIKNEAMDCSFEGLRQMAKRIRSTVNTILSEEYSIEPHVVLVEMPCFTQNAKAAISIGLCWAAVTQLDCVLVEPSFIKIWSGSDPGDKKSKVKEKVRAMTSLDKEQLANDNIVDAVAIGLAFCELVNN